MGFDVDASKVAALKAGTLIEVVKILALGALDKAAKRALVEAAWTKYRAEAEASHQAKSKDMDLVGKSFDGTVWS